MFKTMNQNLSNKIITLSLVSLICSGAALVPPCNPYYQDCPAFEIKFDLPCDISSRPDCFPSFPHFRLSDGFPGKYSANSCIDKSIPFATKISRAKNIQNTKEILVHQFGLEYVKNPGAILLEPQKLPTLKVYQNSSKNGKKLIRFADASSTLLSRLYMAGASLNEIYFDGVSIPTEYQSVIQNYGVNQQLQRFKIEYAVGPQYICGALTVPATRYAYEFGLYGDPAIPQHSFAVQSGLAWRAFGDIGLTGRVTNKTFNECVSVVNPQTGQLTPGLPSDLFLDLRFALQNPVEIFCGICHEKDGIKTVSNSCRGAIPAVTSN